MRYRNEVAIVDRDSVGCRLLVQGRHVRAMQWESLGCIRIGDMVEASPGLQKLGVPIGTKGIVFEIDDPDTCEYTDHYIHVRWFNEFKIRAKVTELVLLESNPFAGHAVVA